MGQTKREFVPANCVFVAEISSAEGLRVTKVLSEMLTVEDEAAADDSISTGVPLVNTLQRVMVKAMLTFKPFPAAKRNAGDPSSTLPPVKSLVNPQSTINPLGTPSIATAEPPDTPVATLPTDIEKL